MKSSLKKIAAGVLAFVLAASLCGCDRGYIMTVDGMEIRNGIYLTYLQSAYSNAGDALQEQNSATSDTSDTSTTSDDTSSESDAESSDESTTTSTESVPITEEEIDGKSGSQWIKDEALKSVRRFVAIHRKCDELGIELSDDELSEINSELRQVWDNENMYVQYVYGYKTMGEYYESQGIGEESMREIYKVNDLQTKLFMHYFGEDGELAVKESEINDYLKENRAAFKMLTFNYKDASGNALEKDEDKKAVKEEAQKYADRINNGEKPVDVFYDYNLKKAEDSANAKAETDYKEDNEEGLSKDEWIKKQVEDANVTKAESDEDLDQVITKDSTSYDEETVKYIFGASADGKATLFETDDKVYLIIKEDITEKTSWKEENNASILNEMKKDEFKEMLDVFGQNYEVKLDQSLVNNKYSPEKLNRNS